MDKQSVAWNARIVTMRQAPDVRRAQHISPPVCHEADPGGKRGKGENSLGVTFPPGLPTGPSRIAAAR
jgi:hypothetical protein